MNKNQLAALLRAALLSAGAALVEHNVVTGARLHSIVNWIVAFVTIVGPIVWSLWAKTHAQQAAEAVKLINSVEAIVVNPATQTASIDPTLSLKPAKTDAVPAAAALLLIGFLALGMTGCTTVGGPTTPATWAKVVAGTVDDLAASGVPPLLDKNPSYAPLVSTVGLAIPAAFGASDLTPDGISATVQSLGDKYGLPVALQQLIARGINRAVTDYGLLSGKPLVTGVDPNFQVILQAFGDGLVQGVKDWQARGPSANTPSTGINWIVPGFGRHLEGPYPVTYLAPDGVNEITDYGDGLISETMVLVTKRPPISYQHGDLYEPPPLMIRQLVAEPPKFHCGVSLSDTYVRDERGRVIGQIVP